MLLGLGRWLSADGAKEMGGSGLQPQQVLDLTGEGVLQLATGAHSSAALSGDGRLLLWGKLLAQVSFYGWMGISQIQVKSVFSLSGGWLPVLIGGPWGSELA